MTDPRFDRLMNLVEAAEDLSEESAEQMLAEACADDPDLLKEARSLVALAKSGTEVGFTQALEDNLGAAANQIVGDTTRTAIPAQIGPYRILDKLGEGGMGAVYLARQENPIQRDVALKVIRAGHADSQTLARFQAERQALARLEHPGIARVYDAGTTEDDVPYFAMEFVRGEPITTYCDARTFTTAARLELFSQVCRAIQHAHYNGIIHRDIKPSNVLVTDVDEKPVVKVIDFGIAKIAGDLQTDPGQMTRIGTLMGTLEYMSPEQAEGSEQIDTRSDVYSLGVLLYELTSGCLPFTSRLFQGRSYTEIRNLLLNTDPPPPSQQLRDHADRESIAVRRGSDLRTLLRQLQGDLDWITQKALERNPDQRYATPVELARETERFLNNEPVHAAAPTLIHRASKFYRRHRLATTAALLLFLAVAGGATLSTIGFLRAAEAQRIAEHEAMVATETSRFLTQALAVAEPGELEGRETTVREILDLAQSRLDAQPAEAPEVEARLRYVLGASYASLGQYARALANLLRAGELQEQSAGATVEQAAQALTTLSDLLTSRGQFVLAQILNEELARLYAAEYGAQSSQHALVQVRIGTLFNQLGARSQARDRLAAAQVIERTLPEADPALANAIAELVQAIEQH